LGTDICRKNLASKATPYSVYQADVIYYGTDLADYFDREFLGFNHRPWSHPTKHIPFWSDLVERNGDPNFGGL
jgi:hypothetical protein